ncbi:alpha/beta-hydrolase [Lactarius pseudohatsudake]|nr:alpha/beta-hydrolase [Lactarius pseudohatsudake]
MGDEAHVLPQSSCSGNAVPACRNPARTHDALALFKSTLDDIRLPDEVNAAERAFMFARTTAVDGFGELSVHCVHQRSVAKGAMPLLFIYVWSGRFVEVTEVLPLLTAVSADRPSFHVLTPSSSSQQARDLAGLLQIRDPSWRLELCCTLTLTSASKYGSRHVKASHSCMHVRLLNGTPARAHRLSYLISSFTARERQFFARTENFFQNCRGYSAEQSTKLQTLGFCLAADSPVGLLAWIYEKLVTWTDAYPWTDAHTTKLVMQFSPSVRIYYELALAGQVVGLSYSPKDLVQFPRVKIVFESEHEVGENFAAYEQPEARVSDLRKMFGKSGHAVGVVPGYTGYRSGE